MQRPSGLAKQRRELIKFWLNWRLAITVVAGVLIVGTAADYLYRGWMESSRAGAEHEAEQSVAGFTEAVAAACVGVWSRVRDQVDVAELASLISAGDRSAIAAREESLAASFPEVRKVWLLGTEVREPDYGTSPPLSYASLELLRKSSENENGAGPEVHLFGGPDQHVALPVRIVDAGGVLVGHALFAFDLGFLQRAVDTAPFQGNYVEVRQVGNPPLVLARRGDASLQGQPPSAVKFVAGTPWQANLWVPGTGGAGAEEGGPPILQGALVIALVAGGVLVFASRRGTPAIKALAGASGSDSETTLGKRTSLADKLSAIRQQHGGEGEDADAAAGAPEAVDAPGAKPPAPRRPPAVELPDSIFRAYDVRGVVGKTLNAEIVREIGRAIGSEADERGQGTVVVGCDGRLSSPELLAALVEGLRAAGREVIDIGRVPTPVLYFATYYLNTGSGVMVTGSHNPADYNGLKIMLAEETLAGEAITALRDRIREGKLASGSGGHQTMDVIPDYIRQVSEDVPVALGESFKVVVDCGNGVAGELAPKLLRALGHDVVELYCDVDGRFPNHHPDPSQPKNLEDLIDAVKANEADIGFAFDGDGDRLGVVDAQGNIIWPDRQMMLFARDVLERNPGAQIVFDVKCTNRLAQVISKLGGKPVMWKTGHSFIKGKMKESGALLGGEMSGHIFFKERWFGFDDALYAAARLLEILLGVGESPAEVFAKLPGGASTPELRVDMQEGEHLAFMAKLEQAGAFGDGKISTIDGIRVDYPDGWGLVRASNTTPSLVLRFEGNDAAALERIQEGFRGALLGVDPGLSLPF